MGLLDIFNSGNKTVDKGIELIDNAFYTDQEKASTKLSLLKAYEPFKIAQRYLALIFCLPYALAWFVTLITSFWFEIDKQIELLTSPWGMASIVLTIVGFYFGGGFLNSLPRKKRNPQLSGFFIY